MATHGTAATPQRMEKPVPIAYPGHVMSGPNTTPFIAHGGNPPTASPNWLDLSTGVNPHPYPLHVPTSALTRLPRQAELDRLIKAARATYKVPRHWSATAAPGTHPIINAIAQRARGETAVVSPTYGEHAAAFGHTTTIRPVKTPNEGLDADTLIVVNPNNPDGRVFADLADLAAARAARNPRALTIIDEAFCDLNETLSAIPHAPPRTVVLRSIGKFYGLAGVRLAFAIGDPALVELLAQDIGPWPVSGSALAAAQALEDHTWKAQMRAQLAAARAALDGALTAAGWRVVGGTDLFRLIESAHAQALHHHLAAQSIWTRTFDYNPRWLRIGLPGNDLHRLTDALSAGRNFDVRAAG